MNEQNETMPLVPDVTLYVSQPPERTAFGGTKYLFTVRKRFYYITTAATLSSFIIALACAAAFDFQYIASAFNSFSLWCSGFSPFFTVLLRALPIYAIYLICFTLSFTAAGKAASFLAAVSTGFYAGLYFQLFCMRSFYSAIKATLIFAPVLFFTVLYLSECCCFNDLPASYRTKSANSVKFFAVMLFFCTVLSALSALKTALLF